MSAWFKMRLHYRPEFTLWSMLQISTAANFHESVTAVLTNVFEWCMHIWCEKRRKGDRMDGREVSFQSIADFYHLAVEVHAVFHWCSQPSALTSSTPSATVPSLCKHTHTHTNTHTDRYLEPMHATQTWTLTHWDHQWLCPGWLLPPSDGWWLSVSLKPACLPTGIVWMKAIFTLRISKGRAF